MQQAKALLIPVLVLVSLSFVACSHGGDILENEEIPKIRLAVLSTNDVEGAVIAKELNYGGDKIKQGGMKLLKDYVDAIRKEMQGNVLLLDAGDIYQGSLEANLNKGRVMIRAFNAIGYDAAAIGNHEFDFGASYYGGDQLGVVRKRISEAKFPFLAANMVWKANGKTPKWRNLYRWKVIEKAGLRIGMIGISTPATHVTTNPENIKKLSFLPMAEALSEALAILQKQKTHANVLIVHEGGMKSGEPLYELLQTVPEGSLQAVVSGHRHSLFVDKINGMTVIQAGEKAQNLGRVDLVFEAQSKKFLAAVNAKIIPICEKYFRTVDDCSPNTAKEIFGGWSNPDFSKLKPLREPMISGKKFITERNRINNVIASSVRKARGYRKKRIAYVSRPLRRGRVKESEVGELFVKALRKRFPNVDAILLNGGGFRKDVAKGAFTYGDLFELYPFNNDLVEVKMTGKELRMVLRILTSGARPWTPIIDGLQISVKQELTEEAREDLNDDGKVEVWEHNRLLRLARADGSLIEDGDEISVLTIDFLVNGGDNLEFVVKEIDRSRIRVYRGTEVREVVLTWLQKNRRPINSSRNPILSPENRRIFPIP